MPRWSLVGLGVVAMAFSFLDRQTLSVLAPTVCRELGLSNAQYGWTGSAFALSLLVATPLAGLFLDRAGVRRGLLATVLLWSIAAASQGLAAGFGSLVIARAFLGAAEAPGFPGAAQVVRSVLPPRDVARGIGYLLSGTTAGALAALFVAVALEQRFGWRAAFFGVGAISLAWVPAWAIMSSRAASLLAVPPESSSAPTFSHPAVVRAALFTAGVSPMLAFANLWWPKFLVARHGISQADVPWYGFLIPVAYDVGAILIGGTKRLLAASALALAIALVPLAPSAWTAVLLAASAAFGLGGAFAISTAGALVAVDRSAVSRAGAAIATVNSLGFVVWSPLIGWSIDRTGSYTPALVFAAVAVAAGAAAWVSWTATAAPQSRPR